MTGKQADSDFVAGAILMADILLPHVAFSSSAADAIGKRLGELGRTHPDGDKLTILMVERIANQR